MIIFNCNKLSRHFEKMMEKGAACAWFGGVDFEEKNENTDQMSHVAGESEDIHGCFTEIDRFLCPRKIYWMKK